MTETFLVKKVAYIYAFVLKIELFLYLFIFHGRKRKLFKLIFGIEVLKLSKFISICRTSCFFSLKKYLSKKNSAAVSITIAVETMCGTE